MGQNRFFGIGAVESELANMSEKYARIVIFLISPSGLMNFSILKYVNFFEQVRLLFLLTVSVISLGKHSDV